MVLEFDCHLLLVLVEYAMIEGSFRNCAFPDKLSLYSFVIELLLGLLGLPLL